MWVPVSLSQGWVCYVARGRERKQAGDASLDMLWDCAVWPVHGTPWNDQRMLGGSQGHGISNSSVQKVTEEKIQLFA